MKKSTYIYLVKDNCQKCVKIGITHFMKERLLKLQVGNACVLQVIYLCNIGESVPFIEAQFHEKFKDKKINGEWFRLDENDIKYIIDFCNNIKETKKEIQEYKKDLVNIGNNSYYNSIDMNSGYYKKKSTNNKKIDNLYF